ncbi:hypothetical protein BDZ94DRAFT_1256761 [Collybia nuda]|uniref:Uncharacterized protein n=1 Tax=Collybia nuda TaxID=64659 RepID=A0A9P6CFM2_9AGAR|nr:hypothetical protein BDZ94DRAFT_1256761 [Collybia nuda]
MLFLRHPEWHYFHIHNFLRVWSLIFSIIQGTQGRWPRSSYKFACHGSPNITHQVSKEFRKMGGCDGVVVTINRRRVADYPVRQ